MLEKNSESRGPRREDRGAAGREPASPSGWSDRADRGQGADPVLHHSFALIIGAIFGIERIKIDDSLSQLFRSDSKEYKQYEAVTKRFPATEFDVLVVVEGKTLLARDNLEKLRDSSPTCSWSRACAA
jgi:hypothetical protein